MNAVPVHAVPSERSTVAAERGMRFLLCAVIMFVAVSDIFSLQLSLAPGLSAKNALLYILAAGLALKLTVSGNFNFQLRGLHAAFFILIAYAILSLIAAKFVVDYPRYQLVASTINLKSRLVDQAVFFLVFFYALQSSRNAYATIKVILAAVMLANVVAVLDAWGIVSIGDLESREDGRVQGAMGESNQYAAFIILFLPALLAATMWSRGVRRVFWLVGLLLSTGAMIMAVSRGAFVAIVVAGIWGTIFLRRYVPVQKMILLAAAFAFVFAIALAVLSVSYGDLLYARVFGDSGGDLVAASSGRTEIWSTAIAAMLSEPITLLTGFGWDVYWSMPFRYSPHNHYLALWFNLGLVGLVCGVVLLAGVVRESRAALAHKPSAEVQATLIAFVFGTLAIAVAVFFVDLYQPWLWFWAYAGLVMRIAVNARQSEEAPGEPVTSKATTNAYGWSGRSTGLASQ